MHQDTDMRHFEELRRMINARLEEIRAPHRRVQIDQYRWLYGALGQVPSEVMFICENPSLAGVERAHIDTVDGGEPDIEAQWWGGRKNPAAKRFRAALYQLGLKRTPPNVKGGWQCYITNVIKEMNVAGDHSSGFPADHRKMAAAWAPILTWELTHVKPRHVFSVGNRAHNLLAWLVDQKLIPRIHPRMVNHYSARSSDETIIEGFISVITPALRIAAADVR